jgi:alpha-glucosidase
MYLDIRLIHKYSSHLPENRMKSVIAALAVVFFSLLLPLLLMSQSSAAFTPNASNTNAMHESLGALTEWKKEPQGLWLRASNGAQMRVVVYTPSIIRVRIAKEVKDLSTNAAATKEGTPPAARWDDHSFAVVAQPDKSTPFTTSETPESITLATDALTVTVRKNPVRVQFFTKQGKLINEDEPAFGTAWIGREVTTHKRLLPGERFIGLGEKTGGLDRSGRAYTNWNTDAFGYGSGSDPVYGTHPFYMGLHSGSIIYGVFFDNSYKSHFDFGASNERFSSFGAEDGEMNYYVMHRASVGEIIEDYTHLTGRMELPPLWSLGYHQCRYSYFPDKEVLTVARTIREKNIPADVLWFDIHYMDAYKVFTWHPERFSQPKKMLAELEGMGFKNVVITDPGIKVEKGYAAYEDGLRQDIFLKYPDGRPYTGSVWPGPCHFPDFTNPKARSWWGDKIKGLVDDGIDGFWTDMNEPAVWGQNIPNMIEFDFDSALFEDNVRSNKATYKKGHNVFGLQMARATYEGSKKWLAGRRPFNLTRASYAGVQRYGAVWTGDNTASDDHLLLGARMVNSMGLAGIAFAGPDVGGFNGGGSRELFARWVTVGAFTPFFRIHAALNTKEQDPWSFGEDVEEVCKSYIELRYRLLPYLYSTFYETTRTGLPVARSLAVNYPFDETIYDGRYDAHYLFGPSILVAPCDSRQNFAKVYLPEGTWYNAHTDEVLAGKQEIIVETPMERLPLFVKAGAIVPMQSVVQFTAQKPDGTLYLHIYNNKTTDKNGAKASFTYYEDDGETYRYQQKDFAKREIVLESSRKKITFAKHEGTMPSKFTSIKLILHGFDALPAEILVAGKKNAIKQEPMSLLKPSAGLDPLGTQAQNLTRTNVKTISFPYSSDAFVIEW